MTWQSGDCWNKSHVNMFFDHVSTYKDHVSRLNQSGIFSSGVSNAFCHVSVPSDKKISILLNSSSLQVYHDRDVKQGCIVRRRIRLIRLSSLINFHTVGSIKDATGFKNELKRGRVIL